MGSDIKQSLAAAEKLLKAGKVAEALAAFDRVVEKSNGNLLTVNLVGDAIASGGQPEKAVPYYARIADQFSHQGFYPKAIAIRKKILRLTPESAEALVGLGDLYVRQEHSAEARGYYLRAADHLLQKKDYTGARAVYERLVAAEPDDPRHRVRLAETRAAAGEGAEAAEELVELGQRLLKSGKPEDAEKSFRRAAELDPGRQDVMKGLIACLTETGRDDEALKILEDEVAKPDAPIELVTELLILYEVNGRIDDANRLLEGERAHELPEDAFRTLVRFHDRRDGQAELWSRLEPTLKGWLAGPRRDKLLALLDAWPGWTETAHLPALEWRLALAGEDGDETVQVRSLERLIEAYQANEMPAEADKALKRLHELRPPVEDVTKKKETVARKSGPVDEAPAEVPSPADVPVAADVASPPADVASPPADVASPPADVASPPADVASAVGVPSPAAAMEVPVEYEAPAVPLSRADEEFVSGRMTQAEILEKYGLLTQAIDQIYEVIERFPGHLEANKHLVTLLRCTSQESTLAQALVKLSLARRAAGRLEVARQAVAEADKLGGIDPHMRGILVALDLFGDVPATPAVAAEPAEAQPVAPAVATKADKPKKKRSKKKRTEKKPARVKIKPADPTP
ncbi:MAG: tetratricopeptide repeat protein, partial [Acidobacteria bacterium]|nr:tetratricopeptide repeat protein [Acidobacteriota bacterium]